MRRLLLAVLLLACSKRDESARGVPSTELVKSAPKPSPPPEPEEPHDPIEWTAPALASGAPCTVGERHAVRCPARTTNPAAWGTDSYTTDSAVCVAALHAGKISAAGGNVAYEIRAGLPAYSGSTRNAVTTNSWAAYTCTFEFVSKGCGSGMTTCGAICIDLGIDAQHCGSCDHACSAGESCRKGVCGPGIDATWTTNATTFACTGTHVIVCPPRGTSASSTVWGTDVYTHDSSICTAAVHAGALTFAGGSTTIEMLPGLPVYKGSTRRGVTTNSWAAWTCSYRFK
ncbi:MAG: LCCL domain-containing protein [Polyangiales bacterium]